MISLMDIANARLEAITYRRVAQAIKRHDQPLWNLAATYAYASGIKVDRMIGKGRTADVSRPRQDFMLAAHEAGYSMPEIGRFLNRDHTTILHGIRAARKRRQA